jgi:hypothetical protein
MSLKLQKFWPERAQVVSCIKSDAEALDVAVFFAVHQPMRFRQEPVGGDQGTEHHGDEHEMLRWFLRKDLGEGTRILPIVGSSGIGKSHVIRWLDAKLQPGEGEKTRHVIRVPKSSSLKAILGLLLKDLEGPQYDEFRERLGKARDELDPVLAAGLLAQHLKSHLRRLLQNANERLANPGLGEGEKNSLRKIKAFTRPDMLPALLSDPTLEREHWQGETGALGRIARHATQEAKSGQSQEGVEFTEHDFDFDSEVVNRGLNQDAKQCISKLKQPGSAQDACKILNDVLDSAKADLMGLGTGSLTGLFEDIRRELYKETPSQELVLLIEDMFVMSGLQGALWEVMVREAIRDGKQEMCTIRTALAFTPGAVHVPDTVLTRAGLLWHLDDDIAHSDDGHDKQEAIHQFNCNLVGAYLNAARLGEEALQTAYQRLGPDHDAWPPTYPTDGLEEEDLQTLEAFGRASNGYPLFPFNKHAIRHLALSGVQKQGFLVLWPRQLIKNVLHKVLHSREQYQEGSFPPAALGERLKLADLITEVTKRVPSAKQKNVQQLLAVWANQPQSLEEAAGLERKIYEEFGLPFLELSQAVGPHERPEERPEERPQERPQERPKERGNGNAGWPDHAQWNSRLENWQADEFLQQKDANLLRKSIQKAVVSSLEFDTLLFRSVTGGPSLNVYIPHARGQGDMTEDSALITLCSDEDRKTPTTCGPIRLDLLALLRHDHHKSWNYEGAETDRFRYLSFVEKHRDQAVKWFLERPAGTGGPVSGLVAALVQGLYVSGRLEGRQPGGQGDTEDMALLFHSEPVEQYSTGDSDWLAMMAKMRVLRTSTKENEPTWLELLLNSTGARQGTGERIHAVDASQILLHIRELKEGRVVDKPEFLSSRADAKETRRRVADGMAATHEMVSGGKLESRRTKLIEWHTKYQAWSGGEAKEALVVKLRGLLTDAKGAGLADVALVEQLRNKLSEFLKAAVENEVSNVERLQAENEPAGLDKKLRTLGLVSNAVVALVTEVLDLVDRNVAGITQKVSTQEATLGEGGVSAATETLASELGKLEVLLERYESLSS